MIIFRVVAVLAGLFFVVAVVLMASAPGVLLQPDQVDTYRTESLVPHRCRQRGRDHGGCAARLGTATPPNTVDRRTCRGGHCGCAIILPFQPSFAAILAIGVVPLIAYPYWRDVRTFPSWWTGVSRAVLILAVLAGAGVLATAAIAYPRQIGGTDQAARGGWWLDYAEHATVLALAGVLAASRGPGWRILRALCSAVWLYLGLVAALVLPHHPGSWGRLGGAAALLVGVGFGVAAWRGSEREVTGTPRHALP